MGTEIERSRNHLHSRSRLLALRLRPDSSSVYGFLRCRVLPRRDRPAVVEKAISDALPWYKGVGKAQLPVLLLWGQGDKTIPSTDIRLIQQLVPQIESHSIKEAGHLPQNEQPIAVNSVLIEFLRNP